MSELIGRIYDCALDPSLWPETLAGIRQPLGFAQATLNLQSMPSGAVLLSVASGIPDHWFDRIADYGPEVVALWGGLAQIGASPLEEPILLSEANAAVVDGSRDNRFHREWHRPQGLVDAVAIGLTRDSASLATASFARHESSGPVRAEETAAIRLLAPHLRRAVTISRLLDIRTVAATTFETVLEAVATPIVIADRQLNLLHANAAATQLLARGDPLSLTGHRLATSTPVATQALALAVAQAARQEASLDRRGIAIPLLDQGGAPRALHVLPLGGGKLRAGLMPEAVAAIFVSAGTSRPASTGAMVADLFGLTPTETRIFDLIAAGHTPGEAATHLGLGVSTVRSHLLRIYDKTGTHRQADLARMAAGLSTTR